MFHASSEPGGRPGADAQGTALNPAMRAGVRCGLPAPLRVATGRAQPEPKHRFGRWRRPATGLRGRCVERPVLSNKEIPLSVPEARPGQVPEARPGQVPEARPGQVPEDRPGQVPEDRTACPLGVGETHVGENCSMKVSTPGRPGADAQGTALNPAMRAGVRCGLPAPLKHFSAPGIHQKPVRLACRRPVPHARSALGKPVSGKNCSTKAYGVSRSA